MHKKLVLTLAVACVLAFAGSVLATPPFPNYYIVKYDGYLHENDSGFVLADTLIVVNNAKRKKMKVWIQVYDKYGTAVNTYPPDIHGETLLNGGDPLTDNIIPAEGFGWITLGMIVSRKTSDPWGYDGAEKFPFKIFTSRKDMPPVVEVKQVIYTTAQEFPGEAIWNPANIKTWAETCLGGLHAPGVVKTPLPNWAPLP